MAFINGSYEEHRTFCLVFGFSLHSFFAHSIHFVSPYPEHGDMQPERWSKEWKDIARESEYKVRSDSTIKYAFMAPDCANVSRHTPFHLIFIALQFFLPILFAIANNHVLPLLDFRFDVVYFVCVSYNFMLYSFRCNAFWECVVLNSIVSTNFDRQLENSLVEFYVWNYFCFVAIYSTPTITFSIHLSTEMRSMPKMYGTHKKRCL